MAGHDVKKLRSALLELFGEAMGSHRSVDAREIAERLGIPRKYCEPIARNSRAILSESDALDAADAWADQLMTVLPAGDDVQAAVDAIYANKL